MPDLSTQLRHAIEGAADPVTLEEVLEGDAAPLTSSRVGTGRGRRLAWWATAAAIAVIVAGAVALFGGDDKPRHAVETPLGTVPADAYPVPGEACGGNRVGDGVQFAGAESADACIGVAPLTSSGATTIYVTSSDGVRIYGGWVLDSCGNTLSSSGQIELGNDNSPVLMMGAVGTDVAAAQYRLRDGTLLTAQTGQVEGVTDRRFYVIRVPANAPIADELFLAADGAEVAPPIQRCQAPDLYLPDDVVVPLVASYIEESSAMMGGLEVGDPCMLDELPGTPPMGTLIDGNINTPECIVVGWMPNPDLPGIPMGYYGQDGSILWANRLPGEDPPTDLRERALEWAATH